MPENLDDGKVAVCIARSKRSIGALKWTLENLNVNEITLVHVRQPVRYIPTPVGNLAVEQVSAEKVNEYLRQLQRKVDEFVQVHKALCQAQKVKAEYVQVEGDPIQKTLVEQISVLGISKLVLGSSNHKGIRRFSSSKIPGYVCKHAPAVCTVLLISNNKLLPRKAHEKTSLSSSSLHSDTEASPDIQNSYSSSQEMTHLPVQAVGNFYGVPEGLGKKWNFVTRFLSYGGVQPSGDKQIVPAGPPSTIPLDEINGVKFFTSPFQESASSSTAETERVTFSGFSRSLNNHKPESEASSSESFESESNSVFSLDIPMSTSRAQSLLSIVRYQPEEEDLSNSQQNMSTMSKSSQDDLLSRLDFSDEEISAETMKELFETPPRSSTRRKSLSELTELSQKTFREYRYSELEAATNGFAEDRKLGEGGYGLVYKGKLQGKDVAIKILKKEGFQKSQEFQHEVELLGRIQHPHMVALLGCCSERGCLVYEFMAKGSLDDRLFCKEGTTPLPWTTRLRIIAEVAAALHFLHSLGSEPIVHRDLKPANILLDNNYVSKVGDVGLAKLVPERLAEMNSTYFRDTTPVGTFAYIDPEYQRTGSFGPKSDVYALGIVILQMLTGRPPVGVHAIVEEAIECGNFGSILDHSAGGWPVAKAEEIACLALQCAEMKRRQRPSLETVLPILDSARSYAENCAAINATKRAMSQGSNSIPSIFLCPLSQKVMVEPVVAADGYTYEYEAMRQWLQMHDASPLTNLKLEHKQLTPHHALHKLISEWKTRHPS